VFTVLNSKEESRESLSVGLADQSADSWGTDQSKSANDGKQIVGFHVNKDGSVTRTPYPNSFIADLKPKGSVVPHGLLTDGYVEGVWPLPDGNVLFTTDVYPQRYNYLYKFNPKTGTVGNNPPAYDNKQAVLNMGERDSVPEADIRSLHHRSILVATLPDKTKALFYGEYNIAEKDEWVALWKSTDMGDSWDKVIEWNIAGHQTRHIHSIVQNPYTGWIYILFGDTGAEAAIVAWDGKSAAPPNNTPLDEMGTYPGWKSIANTPRVRTGDLIFTPPPNGKCVWIPDVDALKPGEKLFGQRTNYDLTGLEATGEVPYVNHIPPIIGVRSNTGNIYWASYHDELAAEKKVHIWKSTDSGLKWSLVTKLDVYTDWTSVPQNLRVQGQVLQAQTTDVLTINARDLEFVAKGQKVGNTVRFSSKTINSENPPTAIYDVITTRIGTGIDFNVIKNDKNVGTSKPVVLDAAKQGTAVPGCCGTIKYTPKPGFAGGDRFSYKLQDATSTSNTAVVDVYVLNAKNDVYTGIADTTKTQTILVPVANGVKVNDRPAGIAGQTFTVTSRIKRTGGSGKGTVGLIFNANGSFSYILTAPATAITNAQKQAAKRGTYQFSYITTLNGVSTLPATATITVK
jgi:hypothetical protein